MQIHSMYPMKSLPQPNQRNSLVRHPGCGVNVSTVAAERLLDIVTAGGAETLPQYPATLARSLARTV